VPVSLAVMPFRAGYTLSTNQQNEHVVTEDALGSTLEYALRSPLSAEAVLFIGEFLIGSWLFLISSRRSQDGV
jgi:hypothetical protein